MKKLLYIIVLIIGLGGAVSCNDFLEIPQTSDVTLDTVFSARNKAQRFLWTVYQTCVLNGVPGWNNGGTGNGFMISITDEAVIYGGEQAIQDFTQGTWSASNQKEFDMGRAYKGIRNANIFIENASKIPVATQADIASGNRSPDVYITDKEKKEMVAEARFLRALRHFDVMQRYGGISVVKSVQGVGSANMQIPRSTLKQTIDFIVSECEDIAMVLPDGYVNTVYRGRVTRGAAYALRSRVLLYAASPLFNPENGKAYYEDGINDMDVKGFGKRELVCLGDYEHNRWREAADAAKDVIDWAKGSGWCGIEKTNDPFKDYNAATSNVNSNEVILADRSHQIFGTWTEDYGNQVRYYTNSIFGSWKRSHGITLNYTKFYSKDNGENQVWNESSEAPYGTYEEFKYKCKEMEPRFQVSVMYSHPEQVCNGLDNNKVVEAWWNAEGAVEIVPKAKWMEAAMYACYTGVGHMKKFMVNMTHSQFQFFWINFRLAEAYLNYAEALNEFSGPSEEVYEALNVTRERAGLPLITNATPGATDRVMLREMIRRERNVELMGEQHRFFDVRRWKIADMEGVMTGKMYGLRLLQQAAGMTPDPASVVYKKVETGNRLWTDRMYLYPYDQSEINLGYLEQNPGW